MSSEGEPVKVAWAATQTEAEMIQGMLRAEGIPSILRGQRGFDVPDFISPGPRDVFVPADAAEAARALLADPETPAD